MLKAQRESIKPMEIYKVLKGVDLEIAQSENRFYVALLEPEISTCCKF